MLRLLNSAAFNSRQVYPRERLFIAPINFYDPVCCEQCLTGFDEVFEKFQDAVVAVEDNPRVLVGKWTTGRTVLIKFSDDQALRTGYKSPEYRPLARYR